MNDTLLAIKTEYKHCQECRIGRWAFSHVTYTGPNEPIVVFIGEGPGRGEDINGKAFIGSSGELLRKTLKEVGFKKKDVGFTNLVACRPCDGPTESNRPPKKIEIQRCKPRLARVLACAKPKAIVLLGRVPEEWAMDLATAIEGNLITMHVEHPASVLRQGGKDSKAWRLMRKKLRKVYAYLENEDVL